jgi:single-strand DNA-binding protein
VYIEGRLKTRKWQDDKGNDRYSTEIQCNDFTFLTTKNESQAGHATTNDSHQAAPNPSNDAETQSNANDDLPF